MSKKTAREVFYQKLIESSITKEDMEKFRKINEILRQSLEKTGEDFRWGLCSGTNDEDDNCWSGFDSCKNNNDCGISQPGGCGLDEKCRICDSCMILHDTCGGDER